MKRYSYILPCLLFCGSISGADSDMLGESHNLTEREDKDWDVLDDQVKKLNVAIEANSATKNRLLVPLLSKKQMVLEAAVLNDYYHVAEKFVLMPGIDVNLGFSRANGSLQLIHVAAQNGHKEIIDLLLARGVDIKGLSKCPQKWSPLQFAVYLGECEVAAHLIEKGAEVNMKAGSDEMSPLGCAIVKGSPDAFRLLLNSEKIDLNHKSSDGNTPLDLAFSYRQLAMANALLTKKADPNQAKSIRGLFTIACQEGDKDIVEKLLDKQVNPNQAMSNGVFPLYMACQNGHENIVKMLLDKQVNPNQGAVDGMTPLYMACQKGYEGIVKMLLAKGADTNQGAIDGMAPLYIACQEGHENIVKKLLAKGADTNQALRYGVTSLYISCQEGHENIVKMLLDKGADTNQTLRYGATPLYVACQEGHENIVKMLLDKGLDPHCKVQIGVQSFDLLHAVSSKRKINNASIFKLLLERAPNLKDAIREKNDEGLTPLHSVAKLGNVKLMQVLLDNDVQIDVTDEYGKTALFYACQFGQILAVKKLLEHRADKTIKDQEDRLPIEIAQKNEHNDVVKLFEQKIKLKSKKNNKKGQKKASKSQLSLPKEKEKEKEASDKQVHAADEDLQSSSHEDAIRSINLLKEKEKEVLHGQAPAPEKVAQSSSYVSAKRGIRIDPTLLFNYNIRKDTDAYAVIQQVWNGDRKLLIVYKGSSQDLSVGSIKLDAAYKEQDMFHGFNDTVDSYLCYGIKIDDPTSGLVHEYGITLPRGGYAIVLPGKIAHQYYDYCYVDYDRDKIELGRFDGAFVYLFDEHNRCFHRMFHQSKASKVINNSF